MRRKARRQKVYEKYGGRCAYCGTKIEYKDMQVDHLIPQRLFTAYDLTKDYSQEWFKKEFFAKSLDKDDPSNLMPSCRSCNHYKGAEPLKAFRYWMNTIHERIEKIYIVRVALRYGIVKLCPFDGEFYFEKFKNNDNGGDEKDTE